MLALSTIECQNHMGKNFFVKGAGRHRAQNGGAGAGTAGVEAYWRVCGCGAGTTPSPTRRLRARALPVRSQIS